MLIVIDSFSGTTPRTHARLLKPNQAQVAVNARLTDGRLQALRAPLFDLNPGREGLQTMFRMVSGTTEKWLTWSKVVDVVRGQVADDALQRIYWTGDGPPQMSTFSVATSGPGPYPTASFVLGVVPPTVKPAVGVTGGSGATEDRSYVYTFVTQYGEESQPSPPSDVDNGPLSATWNITGMQAAPPNSFTVSGATHASGVVTVTLNTTFGLRAGESITIVDVTGMTDLNGTREITEVTSGTQVKVALTTTQTYSAGGTATRVIPHNTTGMTKRIYRTITGASGTAEFKLVAEIAAATTTYDDTVPNATVALATVLPSTDWEMPPTNLRHLITFPNGIAIGAAGKDIYFSEPFRPHAWPTKYRQTVQYDVVGLGYFGTTLVICTTGEPYTITGVDPSTMGGGAVGLRVEWPCVAKRGIVTTNFGVMFPVPQGLAIIGVQGSEIVTREFYTQIEWTKLKPETFVAAYRDGKYYTSYQPEDQQRRILIIDKSEFASVTEANYPATVLWTDPTSGRLYLYNEGSIYQWDADDGLYAQYDWLSKEFVTPRPVNWGAAKVDFDFAREVDEVAAAQANYDATVAANAGLIAAGNTQGSFGEDEFGLFEVGGDALTDPPPVNFDRLLFEITTIDEKGTKRQWSKNVLSQAPFRLPGGHKADTVMVRLAGNVRVKRVMLGNTPQDLKQA